MAKKNARKSSSRGYVIVGRMDDNKKVEVSEQITIREALAKGNYVVAVNEVVQDLHGREHDLEEEIEFKGQYFLVQRVKSGTQ